ncbi:hypothetical protein [Xanthomonas oryzae]|uniref:hypothetical protein n=1 Tax=Xanthomonas oryzae TaxID=347 RepID=UPI003DA1C880
MMVLKSVCRGRYWRVNPLVGTIYYDTNPLENLNMTLREKIVAAIEAAKGDSEQAGMAVCRLLEDEIGLAGNGWFDDDDVLRSEFFEQD